MKNYKRILAAVLAVAAMLSLMACSLVEVDEEAAGKQTVATVNGVEINKEEFLSLHDYYVNMYSYFGYDITSDAEYYAEFKLSLLDSLVTEEVLRQKAVERGFDQLTDADKAAAETEFAADYATFLEDFREQAESENANDATVDIDARMDELARAQLAENGQDYDAVKAEYYMNYAMTNLRQSIYDTVSVTDDDVKAYYDEQVAAQQAEIDADPMAFEAYAIGENDLPALTAPEGYRRVRQILVKFAPTEEQTARITEIDTRVEAIDAELTTLQGDAAETDATADPSAAPSTDNADAIAALEAEKTTLTAEKAELEAAYKKVTYDKATALIARIAAGESFDTLAAQYNEDTGSQVGEQFEDGYFVGAGTTRFYESFTKEGLALKNVGDSSTAPIETDYGYHILYLNELVAPGPVDYATVKDALNTALLTQKQTEAWTAQQEAWTAEATVERFEDRLTTD